MHPQSGRRDSYGFAGDRVLEPGAAPNESEDIVTKTMVKLSALAFLTLAACIPDDKGVSSRG